eukprot:CAMPEP_0178442184 /NCGR_PEP_ID=MMETSP0689_2-20121128/38000_1 /TAXON_ID=160604 /ORGANISM="Amphidinium massartii, Strain CS-259" /LENGTH=240 /DNA_ID=CAMNT_0020065655 /DNA_START=60 /DNA_END=779 /DNA_ORIENTATION=+
MRNITVFDAVLAVLLAWTALKQLDHWSSNPVVRRPTSGTQKSHKVSLVPLTSPLPSTGLPSGQQEMAKVPVAAMEAEASSFNNVSSTEAEGALTPGDESKTSKARVTYHFQVSGDSIVPPSISTEVVYVAIVNITGTDGIRLPRASPLLLNRNGLVAEDVEPVAVEITLFDAADAVVGKWLGESEEPNANALSELRRYYFRQAEASGKLEDYHSGTIIMVRSRGGNPPGERDYALSLWRK